MTDKTINDKWMKQQLAELNEKLYERADEIYNTLEERPYKEVLEKGLETMDMFPPFAKETINELAICPNPSLKLIKTTVDAIAYCIALSEL
jgi:hypothetical protein